MQAADTICRKRECEEILILVFFVAAETNLQPKYIGVNAFFAPLWLKHPDRNHRSPFPQAPRRRFFQNV